MHALGTHRRSFLALVRPVMLALYKKKKIMKFKKIAVLFSIFLILTLVSCKSEDNSNDESDSQQQWHMKDTDCNDSVSKYSFVLNPDGSIADNDIGLSGGREDNDGFNMYLNQSNGLVMEWTGMLYEGTGEGTYITNSPYSCNGTWQAYFDNYI